LSEQNRCKKEQHNKENEWEITIWHGTLLESGWHVGQVVRLAAAVRRKCATVRLNGQEEKACIM
jgi:hypothetical protein